MRLRSDFLRCLAAAALLAAAAGRAGAQPIVAGSLITFNDNGGWSWFEDERAVIDPATGQLLVSSVASTGGVGGAGRGGNVEVVSYNVFTGARQQFILSPNLESDDHNSAALFVRPDGRYVAMYSKHNTDNLTRWRVSTNPGSAASWGPEQTINNGAGTTYSNLYRLSAENGGAGRLYDFTRSVGFNPNFLVSNDNGSTWAYGGRLLQGPGRPYVKYTSNGTDRIWLTATDQHPRNFNNSIYVGYVQGGQLRRADGTVADSNLFDGTGVAPSALTRIFPGDANNIAWVTDIHLDPAGNPYLAFSVRKGTASLPGGQTGFDHRYYYARFDGADWQVNQMAFGGSQFFASEGDYTGLVALDPNDPNSVYISTNVNPLTNAALVSATDGLRHWEIFHGTTSDGVTWAWDPVTANSTVDNIRPIIPDWDSGHQALLWLRGSYSTSYTNYNLAVVGLVTGVPEPSSLALAAVAAAALWRAARRRNAATRANV